MAASFDPNYPFLFGVGFSLGPCRRARAGHGEALLGSPLVPAVVAEELAGVVCPALLVLPHGLRDCTVASVAGVVARGSHAVAKFTAVGSLCSS